MKRLLKNKIIWGLIGVILILGILRWKYGYADKPHQEEVLIPPTPTVTIDTSGDYYLWKLLPYQGTGFTVEKYVAPKTLQVIIKGIDKEIAENMVFKWLEEQKVATESYKIEIGN